MQEVSIGYLFVVIMVAGHFKHIKFRLKMTLCHILLVWMGSVNSYII